MIDIDKFIASLLKSKRKPLTYINDEKVVLVSYDAIVQALEEQGLEFRDGSIKDILEDAVVDSNEDGLIADTIKQGEQKHVAKYKVGDTIYYNSFGRLVSFVIANIVEDGTNNPMYEDKDGNSVFQNDIVEQKPAEEYSFNIESELFHQLTQAQQVLWRKEIEQAYNAGADTQKPAWSEEDEDYYDAIIAKLEVTQEDAALTDNQMKFLKSLKDRVQPQPQQDWSEEDEYNMAFIVELLYGIEDNDKEYEKKCRKIAGWLRNKVIPQPKAKWKPSNEQMEALDFAIKLCDGEGEKGRYYLQFLHKLMNDLNKIHLKSL